MFKTREGGGGQGPFKQCLKKLHNWFGMASLTLMGVMLVAAIKAETHLKPALDPKKASTDETFTFKEINFQSLGQLSEISPTNKDP